MIVGPDGRPILVDERTGEEISPDLEDTQLNIRGAIPSHRPKLAGFWSTVAVIEMTDIAFAIDSILAAIAVVGPPPPGHLGPHPKLWVVITGGMLGVILMRFAAAMFIRLLERFPRFETSAYLLVCAIGLKLVVDWGFNSVEQPHVVDFHDTASVAFWTFWITMALCIAFGFMPQKGRKPAV